MNITGNTVFLPGATSGIGLALAERLDAAGNTVIVGGRRQALLDEIAATHPGIDTVRIDTADADSITDAARTVVERHPRLNVLVTRAKWQTILVTSIRSHELAGVNPNNAGAVALRNFIAYCLNPKQNIFIGRTSLKKV